MKNLSELIQRIRTDSPYSIAIFDTVIALYRVEGYDLETDIDIFGHGTLAVCNERFETLKTELCNAGHRVQETGCRPMVPRHMLINASPYHIWKVLYQNLAGKPCVLSLHSYQFPVAS